MTGLAWWTVAPHLLVSLVLLFVSIVVLVRLDETDDPPVPVVPRPLQLLSWATVGVLVALCVAGTLVTAAGPHGGDDETPRLDLPVRVLAQMHADLMFTYLGLLIAMTVGFLAVRAPRKLMVQGVPADRGDRGAGPDRAGPVRDRRAGGAGGCARAGRGAADRGGGQRGAGHPDPRASCPCPVAGYPVADQVSSEPSATASAGR